VETPFYLAALPQLEDEEFSRAVILVLEYDDAGAFGVILNKPFISGEELPTQLVAEIKDTTGETVQEFEQPLFRGGPVREETIYTLHTWATATNPGTEFAPGCYMSSDPELFQDLLTQDGDEEIKKGFFLGCSSWEKGQLDAELRGGSWLAIPFVRDFLFREGGTSTDESGVENGAESLETWSEEFWKEILKHAGCDPLTLLPHGSSDFGLN
jgi:putative transcriptional regulator